MKEIITTSANFMAVIEGGKLVPQIEIGIITSEVGYALDFQGVTKTRNCEALRFAISPDQLRKMAHGFMDFAEQCETEISKAKGENQ